MKESQLKSITMSLREKKKKKKTNRFTHTQRPIYMKLRIYFTWECRRMWERIGSVFSERERHTKCTSDREKQSKEREKRRVECTRKDSEVEN